MKNIIYGNIIDIKSQRIFSGAVHIESDTVIEVSETVDKQLDRYILPGFVDSHVHIESSMLGPTEFGRLAMPHGTVATVSDPHEIANVLGLDGVKYMIEESEKTPLKIYYGAPSCVPATTFETAGAVISAEDIAYLFEKYDLKYLSEMMNYPGVIFKDPMVLEKLAIAKKYGKVIDGHAPGLRGQKASDYIQAGISTDHECFTYDEALEKLKLGMKILIREGSAAKNFDALIDLISDHYQQMMFCSDDKHPDDLELGHIDQLVKRSLAKGNDLMKTLQVACINPVEHYKLDVGLLRKGDPADFIIIDNPTNFRIEETWVNGTQVASWGSSNMVYQSSGTLNNFVCEKISDSDLELELIGHSINVIEALDGQLITKRYEHVLESDDASKLAANDILKMVVVNRYRKAPIAKAFIKNFNFRKGAIASSVAHDSHNIVGIGYNDEALVNAVNAIIQHKGGLAVYDGKETHVLPLPIAGLMTPENGNLVADQYTLLNKKVKEMGCTLSSPFMTLSFMALLVIPDIKLSDKGLFDGSNFEFLELFNK